MQETSTKPYFMRALYEWCTDNGYTPYLAVKVTSQVKVPMEFVRNGEIVLNISFGATSALKMDNEAVTFKARFGGVSRDIYVPVDSVMALYASENGQGMAFEVTPELTAEIQDAPAPEVKLAPVIGLAAISSATAPEEKQSENTQKKSEKPSLKIIK